MEVEPRREGPTDFPRHQFLKIKNNNIKITNDSNEPVKIKKNTPLCQIRATVEVKEVPNDSDDETEMVKKYKPGPPDLSKIQFDPGNQFSTKAKSELN